jgi:phosphate transport system substrate-binding protein
MLKNFFKVFTIVCLICISFGLMSCKKESKEKIIIKGSTTVLPITQKVSEAYRAINKISITIEGSGSGNGIKSLIDSTCNIANSSREMNEAELQSASEKGIKVKEITAAYDMIVPVVNPANPIKKLTTAQLRAIYDGSVTNWKELNGNDGKIVVISRDTSSGTYEIWHEKVMNKKDVKQEALLQASNGAIVSSVANNPLAIGYVGFGYINNSISPLTIDDVEPLLENGKSGKFPVSRKLYMYVDENKLSAETKKFIDFILSLEGQKLVKEAGFIPISE